MGFHDRLHFRRFSSTLRKVSESLFRRDKGSVVAVGMSGGEDSSVAAHLLQRQGYEVFGMHMWNRDSTDETGHAVCSAEEDYECARRVCKQLGISLFEDDYKRHYWVDVFESFTREFAAGFPPNPDLACNKFICGKQTIPHHIIFAEFAANPLRLESAFQTVTLQRVRPFLEIMDQTKATLASVDILDAMETPNAGTHKPLVRHWDSRLKG